MDTEDGIKTFRCGGEESKYLEKLLKKDDEVVIKLLNYQSADRDLLYIKSLNQILEINGERQK